MTNAHGDNFRIPELDGASFGTAVLKCEEPALVAFMAPWSKPCQVVYSVLGELEAQCAGKFRIFVMNVDDSPDLGALYDIQSIPTLLCFVGGEVRVRMVGTVSQVAILAKLEPFIGGA